MFYKYQKMLNKKFNSYKTIDKYETYLKINVCAVKYTDFFILSIEKTNYIIVDMNRKRDNVY